MGPGHEQQTMICNVKNVKLILSEIQIHFYDSHKF